MSKRISLERDAKTKAKKPRIEEGNGTSYDEMSDLERLPDDTMEKLFEYLSFKDILELSVVCHRLKKFIAGSFEAKKKIVFHFPTEASKHIYNSVIWQELSGQRNYSRVVFESSYKSANFTKILCPLKKFGSYVKEITCASHATKDMMKRLLNFCPNVRSINVLASVYNDYGETRHIYTGLTETYPSLQELKLPFRSTLLHLFLKCQLKHFEAYGGGYTDRIKFFLKKQQNLETLCLSGEGNLFIDEPKGDGALTNVPFKLKKLQFKCIGYVMTQEEYDNYQMFIYGHRDTLKYLDICGSNSHSNMYRSRNHINCDLVSPFAEFRAIEKVILNEYVITDSVIMEHIQKMSAYLVSARGDQKFNEKFPNLVKLEVSKSRYNASLSSFMTDGIAKLAHLQKLTLRSCPFIITMKLLNVEILVLKKCDFDQHSKLIAAKLTHLYLIQCKSVDWLADFLNRPETNLKLLFCRSMTVSHKCRIAIDQNVKKIKKIKMINVNIV